MEPALKLRLTKSVAAAVELRETTNRARFFAGEEPVSVTVCRGPGRCYGGDLMQRGLTCAFCVKYPDGWGTSSPEVQADVCNRIEKGN